MPNCLAKKCAISLQSFANGCIACNGEFPFPPPGPVDLPTLCAVPEIAQKRQKNAEGLGRRSAFFLGARLIGAAAGRGLARAKGVTKRPPRAAKRWARAAKRRVQNGKIGRKMAEDIKKRRVSPPFLCFLACNCCPSGHGGNGQAFSLKDASPDGVGLLRGDGVAQRLETRDPGFCRSGVYSAEQVGPCARLVPIGSVQPLGAPIIHSMNDGSRKCFGSRIFS